MSKQLSSRVPVSEGAHCKYCPSFEHCPAKTALIRNMVDAPARTPITDANAPDVYAAYLKMRELMKRATAELYAYASKNPIDIGDGRVFGLREKPGNEKLDGDATYELLVARFGRELADLAVSRSATKTGIGEAVRAAKKDGVIKGTLKAENESILVELRASGAITRKPTSTVEEYRPKPQLEESPSA